MSRDEEVKNPRLFDVRTIDRNIRKGMTTRKDYEKYVKSLPDVADKAAPPEALSADADDDFDDLEDEDDLDDEAEGEGDDHGPGDAPNGAPTA
jgi:hypothetical protein